MPASTPHLEPSRLNMFEDETIPLSTLSTALRKEAVRARRYNRRCAELLQKVAEAVDRSLSAELDEILSIQTAANEWGWSYEGLRRKVAAEPELNAGTEGSPAIRRRDLPKVGTKRQRTRKRRETLRRESEPGAAAPSTSVFDAIKQRALSGS